jgi:alpha-glucosidase
MYTQWYAYGMLFDIPGRTHMENLCNCKSNAPDRIGHLESNLANTRLRYGLIPYVYSLAHRAHLYGEPVMPPPIIYYQTDNNLRSMGHEKMIGRDLLGAIVARHGERARDVYLPEGTWYDWHSGERLNGGAWIRNVPVYREGIFRPPLYARAGAIIPMMHVDELTLNAFGKRKDGTTRDELIIRAFASADPDTAHDYSFTLYEDDGTSTDYQNDAVRRTIISQSRSGDSITVVVGGSIGTYVGAPDYRDYTIRVTGAGPVREVVLNGTILPQRDAMNDPDPALAGWHMNGGGTLTVKSGSRSVAEKKKFIFRLGER